MISTHYLGMGYERCRLSVQKCCGHDYVLAGPGKGGVWHTFMFDGDGDGSCLSSGFGVVDGGSPLCSQHGLVLEQLSHLGVEGYLLTGKLIMSLSRHPLVVDLPGASLCLLFLLVGLLLIGEELHS
jgi:hypothetical protein